MKKTLLILAMVVTSMMFSCKPEPEPEPNTPGSVKVTTSSVSNITETSAKCGGTVTASGYSVGNCGLCYSELPNPTINSYITSDQMGTGTFTSTMSGLEPGTKYYVRAYATTSSGTLYGEQKEFTTDEPTTGTINGHEWVDLGLPSGLKWATCNVGASSPEDYGDYYAWGETTTKSNYSSSNSATYGLGLSELQSQGYIDGNGNLTPSHDAASANWGGSWRMPTEQESKELTNTCTWTWTTQNGINGCKVTGPNGNHIFLPTAGGRGGSSLYYAGESGFYGSSTPAESSNNETYSLDTYSLYFDSSNLYVGWGARHYGLSARPVSE